MRIRMLSSRSSHSLKHALLAGAAGTVLFAGPAFSQSHSTETVVVTASPLTGHGDSLASISSRVDATDILRSGGSTLADALADIPGVSTSGFSAGSGRPIIRGMDASRVRVLEDGTSSSDASDIGPAPNIAAISTSRINPVMRDSSVNPPTDASLPNISAPKVSSHTATTA